MRKTIIFGDDKLTIKLNFATMRVYRAEFGGDFITDLLDVSDALNPDPVKKAIARIGNEINGLTPDEIQDKIYKAINLSDITESKIPTAETQEKALKIIWVMAKGANKSIPDFDEWVDGFEGIIPLNAIISECVKLLDEANKGTVELKN